MPVTTSPSGVWSVNGGSGLTTSATLSAKCPICGAAEGQTN